MRIGLSGYNAATGLGYQNRDITRHLPICKWLVVENHHYPQLPIVGEIPVTTVDLTPSRETLEEWLKDIDCLLFYEQPLIVELLPLAKVNQVIVVCVANWEWLAPSADWLSYVDLFVCPNQHTLKILQTWKEASGNNWEVCHVPAPIDSNRFSFKQRTKCESFLFVNGNGGVTPFFRGLLGDKRGPRRKGLDVVLDAARQVPDIPVLLRSQQKELPNLPRNIELLPSPSDNTGLFNMGDVAIQPSMFEGTGLQLLETLSTGMPLVTTDAAPMNENPTVALIRCSYRKAKLGNNIIKVAIPDPNHLAEIMRSIYLTDISEHSIRARNYVVLNHTWNLARKTIFEVLNIPHSSE